MKNAAGVKSTIKTDSPKTPGGISKSLLTPCRRVGLSRNWRKSGPSPFISPLASNSANTTEVVEVKKESRKRKERVVDTASNGECDEDPKPSAGSEVPTEGSATPEPSLSSSKNVDVETTPSRNIELPRKKKSKILIAAINKSEEVNDLSQNKELQEVNEPESSVIGNEDSENIKDFVENVSKPVKTKSKKSPKTSAKQKLSSSTVRNTNNSKETDEKPEQIIQKTERSPNELTKECIVVIQKKIFKTDAKNIENKQTVQNDLNDKEPGNKQKDNKTGSVVSQTLFDSDSDEVPLSKLNKTEDIKPRILNLDDDDFETKEKPVKKLKDKTTSISGLKVEKDKKKSSKDKIVKKIIVPIEAKPSSQSSYDDDEDFDFDNKKTILIRKTYEKVAKPLKAKSTGSITQKDIDDLKARIETKKKLLLAKAMTTETEELRGLIKKWQTGCQDALMELMELMKNKFPDKQNMDYSEMLQTLKIPASLVGYDAENDCFCTPDDASIILSKFNDL